jgi:hypothetical protein
MKLSCKITSLTKCIVKLREMIAYVMWGQRRCKHENWGPIPIYIVDETSTVIFRSHHRAFRIPVIIIELEELTGEKSAG